jgi:ABC-type nitrate/sulfonate/bicarbonate transport system permease component
MTLAAAIPVLLVVLWWFASANSQSIYYPPLSEILTDFKDTWLGPYFVQDLLPSMGRMFAGLGLACVLGISLGILLGRIATLRHAINPVLQFIRSIPAVALVPLSIALFGIGDVPKILLIAFVAVFPILLNSIDGVRGVDPGLEQVARSYRLTRIQRVMYVQLPSAAPQMFAGIRVSLGLSFIMMVVTEMVAARNGVGFQTLTAQQTFHVPQMWAGMIVLGLLGALVNQGFVIFEHRLLQWHYLAPEQD